MHCVWVEFNWKTGDDRECPFEEDWKKLKEKYGEDEFEKHFFETFCKFCLEGQKAELLSEILVNLKELATVISMRD